MIRQIPEVPKVFLQNLLQKLVQINSENPPGTTQDIANYLIKHVFTEEEGFKSKIIKHKKNDVEMHSLIAEIGTGKQRIVLCGHLDTVPAGNSKNWEYDPFSAKIQDNILYGRGSADMKGGVVALIGVMKQLQQIPNFLEKYTLVFAGTADEEAGMAGATTLATMGIMKDAILLIIGEATSLKVGVAEKGVLWIKMRIQGKAAHGSKPENGINAIEGAMRVIPQLYTCLDQKLTSELLGKSTLNIGTILGGTKINVVPEEAIFELDYRLIPEQDSEKVIEQLKKIDVNPCKVSFTIEHNLPPLLADIKNIFIQNLRESTNNSLIGMSYGTDAAKLIDFKNPTPFVIFGPGNSEIIHQANEFVPLNEVYLACDLLTKTLIKTYLY